MGFLGRKSRAPAHAASPSHNGHHGHHSTTPATTHGKTKKSRGPFSRRGEPVAPYSMGKRPTFGQWLKHTALDIVTMAILGAIGLGVSTLEAADCVRLHILTTGRSTLPILRRPAASLSRSPTER